jgi:uncharacterized protein with von Willebrand factor type A (vWA) domain
MTTNSIDDYFGLSPATFKALTSQTNNVVQDSFDSTMFNDLMKVSDTFKQTANVSPISDEPWKALLKDVWAGFYKASPELNQETNIDSLYKANRPFVEKFMEDPATAETRIHTMLDDLASGIATIEAAGKLNEELKNRPELKEALDGCKKAQKQQQQGDEEGAAQTMQQVQQSLQGAATEVRQAMRAAAKAGQKKVDDMEQTLSGWGLSTGDLKSVPLGDRLKLVDRITRDKRLKQVADLVGRFRNLAKAKQKDKVKKERDEIYSIKTGNDLEHVLPQELASLRHSTLKLDFYRKYTEKSLLQYDLKVKEPKGRGPIVACIDISGSMSGQPLDWAIAVALGLVDTAARQKRRSKVIFFDTEVKKEVEFAAGERDIHKIMDIAETGAAGGTKYEPALNSARQTIESVNYKNADIVFVTDGYCALTDEYLNEFNAAKKRMEFRCFTVLIGNAAEGLKKWNDKVWAVQQLDEETAGEIFEEAY